MLAGSRIVITGANQGLGRAIAKHVVAQGAEVALVGRREPTETLEALASPTAFAQIADLSDQDQIKTAFDAITERWEGRIDGLVNNAAPFSGPSFVDVVDIAKFRATLDAQIVGTFACVQAALPGLRASGRGRVVTIGSDTMFTAPPGFTMHTTAKSALLGLTRGLARDLGVGTTPITVNLLVPGFFMTDSTADTPQGLLDMMRQRQVLSDRMDTPDDMVGAVTFFLSDGAARITGQTLITDSGVVMG